MDLAWDGVDTTDSGEVVSSSDWVDVHLGIGQSALDGNLDFLGDLDTNSDVSVSVSSGDDSLKSGSLTGLGLLLDGKDAHDLIRELSLGVSNESVNNWSFLDWDGVGVNFLEGFNLAGLDESSKLGEWGPLISLESTSATALWSSSTASSGSEASSSSSSSSSGLASCSAVAAGVCPSILIKGVFLAK